MDQNNIDTNIEFFARHIDKIRRLVALFCIFLIVLATAPFMVLQYNNGWSIQGVIQACVLVAFVGLFVHVFLHGFSFVVGLVILLADIALIGFGAYRPDAHQIIVMFFFTPPLIAYLFFQPRFALASSVFSYCVLNYVYFTQYFEADDPSANYVVSTIIFAGIAFNVGIHIVISSRYAIERKLMELAHSDVLTGLPNRLYLESRVEQEIERCQREGSSMCLALVDLDFFKKVNDSNGHDCGDKVLAHVANVLNTSTRVQDICCRFGGEELVIIMPSTTLDEALPALERVRAAIETSPMIWKRAAITVTASFGCAEIDPNAPSFEALFEAADKYLYVAKENGRNQVFSRVS